MCMSANQYTTAKVVGVFIGMVGRVIRSTAFNIFVFVLGFGVGYVYTATRVHYYGTKHTAYEYVQLIDKKISDFEKLDLKYTLNQDELHRLIKELKILLSHDAHPECKTSIGKILLKRK